MRWLCVAHHFQVKRSRSHRLIKVFYHDCSVALCLRAMAQIHPWGDDVSHIIPRSTGERSRSFRLLKLLPCGSVAIWPIHFIWGINTTHERGDVSRIISRSKGQRSVPCRSFEVSALSAPWRHTYLTNSIHMWHKYNPSDDVSCTISRKKGQTKVKVTQVAHILWRLRVSAAINKVQWQW